MESGTSTSRLRRAFPRKDWQGGDDLQARDMFVLVTMDAEPARMDVTAHALEMSSSGPCDYQESQVSIRGYADVARRHGFPITIFAHPEIAMNHHELLLDLEKEGACLGLHLHPYKLSGGRYRRDLGWYSASELHTMLREAAEGWEKALGHRPLYFRPGYFSANDNTFRVLCKLGFRGGSVSIPGRVLPAHASVWAGAEPYPHRAQLSFRQVRGGSDFIEVPASPDFGRPVPRGDAGEQGYEWLYVPSAMYDHRKVVRGILERFRLDRPDYPVIVTDTHNDQDYTDGRRPATGNLEAILNDIVALSADMNLRPVGCTLDTLCDLVLSGRG